MGSAVYRWDEQARKSKMTNGNITPYVWDRGRIAADIAVNKLQNFYYYGADGIAVRKYCESEEINVYLKNIHGNVMGVTDETGSVIERYRYDAFGNNLTDENTKPFGYCGEYFDNESGLVYLRNRYYDPETGRFITEDPAKDGVNWYSYAANDPVNFIDPLGLFDYNTQLRYNPSTYNVDVKVLQNELAWNGYLNSNDIDGYFGNKTLAAVNQYKKDKGLWNFGEYEGVVGLTTWTSMGLIYRSQEDINAGVQIITGGSKQYFDVSIPVTTAVKNAQSEFANHKLDVNWFIERVQNDGKWNVKRNAQVWSDTLGISKNSYGKTLFFYGRPVVVDDIGNITFGYLGRAIGFSADILKSGSMVYHIYNHGFSGFDNEFSDEAFVQLGSDWYDGIDIQVRFGAL